MDNLFLLAVAAFGFGLSLATYRLFARSNEWPMGALQADLPIVPVMLGLVGLGVGLLFATARGADDGGWAILGFGFLLAVVWTGFMRVGSQISLFFAPLATFLLLLGWLAGPLGYSERRWATERPAETLERKGLIKPSTETSPAPADTTLSPSGFLGQPPTP